MFKVFVIAEICSATFGIFVMHDYHHHRHHCHHRKIYSVPVASKDIGALAESQEVNTFAIY